MSLTTTDISLDFYNNKIIVINAKQGDSDSRTVLVTCTEYGKPFNLDKETMSVFIRCSKPDGFYCFNNAEITDDGKAEVELTQQMLAAYGKCRIDLTILKFDATSESATEAVSILSTMTFFINVGDYPMDSTVVVSSNEFDAMMKGVADMVEMQKETTAAIDTMRELSESVTDAEAARVVAEESREKAEEKREETIANCEKAIEDANNATTAATTAAEKANAVIEPANQATYNANQAADNANTAAESANSVIETTNQLATRVDNVEKVVEEAVSSLEDYGGTVEITSTNPERTSTVLTVDPSAEEINIYSAEEIDSKISELKKLATTNEAGLLSPDDKIKLNKITSTESRYKKIATTRNGVSIKAPDSAYTSIPFVTTSSFSDEYYTFVNGETTVKINKDGLYFVNACAYLKLDDEATGGGILVAIKDANDNYIAEVRQYIEGLSSFGLSVNNMTYLTAGTILKVDIYPAAYMTGTEATTIEGGYIQLTNIW